MFLAGMSSGACLAAVLGLRFAKLFAAIGLHSGVACGAAASPMSAFKVLASGADADTDSIARDARAQTSPRALPVPVCVVHGERDEAVAPRNAVEVVRQFIVFNGLPPVADGMPRPDASATKALPAGRTMTTEDYAANGRVVARLVRVAGLGHAWSGGDASFAYNDPQPPDATALFGEFFAAHCRRRDTGFRPRPED
jgi:poly(3-hydroxybutyrate) depolymerase